MQSTSETNGFQPVKLYSTSYSPPDESNSSPIIFIHGLFSSFRTWKYVMYDISNKTKRKVYAIDLRNHGKSEWHDLFSMDLFVDDLENFMMVENIPKAVLVGHSLGGRIAVALAFRKPEMVEKLVIEDINLVDTEKTIENSKKTVKFLTSLHKAIQFLPSSMTELEAQKKFQGYVAYYFPEMAGNASAANISLSLPFYKDVSGNFVWDLNADALVRVETDLSLLAVDVSNNPKYHGETLLLGAEKSDVLREEDVDIFLKHIPKCQPHFFKGAYHNLHIEFPEKYKEMVTNFIG